MANIIPVRNLYRDYREYIIASDNSHMYHLYIAFYICTD